MDQETWRSWEGEDEDHEGPPIRWELAWRPDEETLLRRPIKYLFECNIKYKIRRIDLCGHDSAYIVWTRDKRIILNPFKKYQIQEREIANINSIATANERSHKKPAPKAIYN